MTETPETGPAEATLWTKPTLYSAGALKIIESIREQLGQVLKQHALDLAKRNGRNLVTDADVWEALDSIDIADIFADSEEEDGDPAQNERPDEGSMSQLTDQEIQEVLSKPNGDFALLELVRAGRIEAEKAVTAIDDSRTEPFVKRLFLAILDTFFSKK